MQLPTIQKCGIFILEVVSLQERSDIIHPCSKVFISCDTDIVCRIHKLKHEYADLQASPTPWFILSGVSGTPRLFLSVAAEDDDVIR